MKSEPHLYDALQKIMSMLPDNEPARESLEQVIESVKEETLEDWVTASCEEAGYPHDSPIDSLEAFYYVVGCIDFTSPSGKQAFINLPMIIAYNGDEWMIQIENTTQKIDDWLVLTRVFWQWLKDLSDASA